MGASVAAENKVTIMLIVGTPQIMRAKGQHGIRNMELTVRKLDWKSLTMTNYYCPKQLPKIV